jgi:hypothetical protein
MSDERSIERLAEKFVELLRRDLTPRELRQIRILNAHTEYENACATHDFLDANMTMLEAWVSLGYGEIDAASAADATLWSKAWDLARERHLVAKA